MRKKCSSDQERLLKFEAKDREFDEDVEIPGTIYSNSERSDQFLVQQGLEIHGLEEHGTLDIHGFNWFPKHLRYTDFLVKVLCDAK